MKNNFVKCGLTGWCLEVAWTGLESLRHQDTKMKGNTSILMFPIYGLAFLIKPIYSMIQNKNIMYRGGIYTCCIFFTEFVTGSVLKKRDMCPWDYSNSKYNVKGLIRLDYAPAWFAVGLLYEKMLKD